MPVRGHERGADLVHGFVTEAEAEAATAWLTTAYPIWEARFSNRRAVPAGESQRMLLRPVLWLGSWQFACLNYYHPPRGVEHRCVRAEPFPEVLQGWVSRAEARVRGRFPAAWIPAGWKLNSCLVNFYGDRIEGKREDRARVGAHRDYEPGPVASVSLGEKAMFQFVTRTGQVQLQEWLVDRSLQCFGGPVVKDKWFHRVQRAARSGLVLPPVRSDFVCRRVNFTFRYVPDEHTLTFAELPQVLREDVREYVAALAVVRPFWAAALAAEAAA